MENAIPASCLNDFIFCPASIYFHRLYGNTDTMMYQTTSQINGTNAHKTVDERTYSTRKNILTSLDAYSEEYGITCKIDMFDIDKRLLTERKNKIKQIYDGYVFQLYAQYFSLREMGYEIDEIKLYSMEDNKSYAVLLPEEDPEMLKRFKKVIHGILTMDLKEFVQTNPEKCKHCIYEPACDRSLV